MVINQKFIAEKAGVSQKTVSLFFNTPDVLSENTREKVRSVVRQYNYFPNQAARSMRSNSFRRIACVIPQYGARKHLQHPQLITYLDGISSTLSKQGYSLVFEPVYIEMVNDRIEFPDFFETISVDGIIGLCCGWIPPELDQRVNSFGLPVVWLNRAADDPRLACIPIDERSGVRQMVRHLREAGHRRIGWFGPDFSADRKHHSAQERYAALTAELTAAGGVLSLSMFYRNGAEIEGLARTLSSKSGEIDALVCYDSGGRNVLYTTLLREHCTPERVPVLHFASEWELRDYGSYDGFVELPEFRLGELGAEDILARLAGRETAVFLQPPAGEFRLKPLY